MARSSRRPRQARRATAEAERTERESAGVELRRSLRRRCVTQAGSLEGSGAVGSGGDEGRPGQSGARGLILSLRRVGTQAERDRADEGAAAEYGFPAKRALPGQGRAAEWTSFRHECDGSDGDGACENAAKVGRGGEPAARSSCEREPRRSERQQVRRAKVSLPSRRATTWSGLEDNLPEMSSAGTDGCRTCGGTEQDSAPDAEAG